MDLLTGSRYYIILYYIIIIITIKFHAIKNIVEDTTIDKENLYDTLCHEFAWKFKRYNLYFIP